MTDDAKHVLQAGLALPVDDRLDLAEHLLLSLPPDRRAEIDAAWDIDINRRLEEIDSGRATLLTHEEAMERLRARRKV